MSQIAPCITVENSEEYQASIERLKPFAERVHLDISDGEFAPRKLIDPAGLTWPTNWTVDIHAMVKRPREYLQAIMLLRPHTVVLHAEADEDITPLLKYIKDNGSKAGVALLKTTAVSTVQNYIQAADHVMIFSGDLGHYGGKASMLQLEKVRQIKAVNPQVEIAWDGGVSIENAYTLSHGGVDVLNAGGAINNAPDPAAAYQALVTEISRQGTLDLL